MLKTSVLILIIMACGWYFFDYPKEPLIKYLNDSPRNQKCTTDEGAIIYGRVPKNTKCRKVEIIDDWVTVGDQSQINTEQQQLANLSFSCDGRTHCSQMHSCQEAVFFLNNCPDTKMDGDRDGVPCEKQWCG